RARGPGLADPAHVRRRAAARVARARREQPPDRRSGVAARGHCRLSAGVSVLTGDGLSGAKIKQWRDLARPVPQGRGACIVPRVIAGGAMIRRNSVIAVAVGLALAACQRAPEQTAAQASPQAPAQSTLAPEPAAGNGQGYEPSAPAASTREAEPVAP